jgi:hypothetical protein
MENDENWIDVIGYEGLYQVSDLGNVKNLSRDVVSRGGTRKVKEKILKPYSTKHGYLFIKLSKNNDYKAIAVHKLVALCFLNHVLDGSHKIIVDHINGIKTDNRLVNLQLISSRENVHKGNRVNGTSKYIGVSFYKSTSKWKSQIYLNGKRIHIGYFNSEEEAYNAYLNKLNYETKI